jgi:hypothetical protein
MEEKILVRNVLRFEAEDLGLLGWGVCGGVAPAVWKEQCV